MTLATLAPSFDAIRERLFAMAKQTDDALVASLVSRVPGEGVTTVSVGLARAVARTHTLRTLLIAYDGGPQGAGAALGVPESGRMAWDGADDGLSLKSALVAVEPGRLDLLTLDQVVPSGLLADSLWSQVFHKLRAEYNVVLVDAGSTHRPQAMRWSRIANLRLLVVDTTRTTAEELERLKVELRVAGQALDGAILNKRSFPVPGFLYRHVR